MEMDKTPCWALDYLWNTQRRSLCGPESVWGWQEERDGPLAITPLPENLPITLGQKCRAFIPAIKYLSSTLHPHLTLHLMILKHQSAYFNFIAGFALHSCSHWPPSLEFLPHLPLALLWVPVPFSAPIQALHLWKALGVPRLSPTAQHLPPGPLQMECECRRECGWGISDKVSHKDRMFGESDKVGRKVD